MKQNMKAFIKYLIVVVCSAIVTFLTSSCTAGLVIGKNQRQQQENNISTRADSSHFGLDGHVLKGGKLYNYFFINLLTI